MINKIQAVLSHFFNQDNYMKPPTSEHRTSTYIVTCLMSENYRQQKSESRTYAVYGISRDGKKPLTTDNTLFLYVEFETDTTKEIDISLYLTNLSKYTPTFHTIEDVEEGSTHAYLSECIQNMMAHIKSFTILNIHNKPHHYIERALLQ